jgi:hypothetical protein
MAMAGFSWIIPFAVGPLAAGAIMDHGDPHWVWYGGALLSGLAVVACYIIHLTAGKRFAAAAGHIEPDVAVAQVDHSLETSAAAGGAKQ